MSEKLGQPVIVENRGGAGGNVGMDAVAKAAPDGYTIGFGAISTNALNPHVYKSMAFDPRKALTTVRVPVLALTGTLDGQVVYRENLDAIAAALKAAGNSDVELVELRGLNHLFQTAETGAISEYSLIEETLSPTALQRVGDWIQRHTQKH